MDKVFSTPHNCDSLLEQNMDWLVVFSAWSNINALDVF